MEWSTRSDTHLSHTMLQLHFFFLLFSQLFNPTSDILDTQIKAFVATFKNMIQQ